MPGDGLLTIEEVAALLKIADKTAYIMAERGELAGFKVGGQWRLGRSDIDDWIEERKRSAPGKGEK